METILLYIFIMCLGVMVARYKLIPEYLKKYIVKLQTYSLMFLLGILGYKLGTNEELLKDIHHLGFQALIIAVFSMTFTILFIKLIYKKGEE